MLFFCIKKTFFNMWDNFIEIFLMNVGMIAVICIILLPVFLPEPFLAQVPQILLDVYLLFGFLIINFYIGAVFRYTQDISDNKERGFLLFFKYLAGSWKQSIVNFVIIVLLLLIFYNVVLHYIMNFIENGSVIDFIFGVIILSIWINISLLCLYFFPSSFRINRKILKSLQASYILFFQNTGFTYFMLLVVIILISISLPFIGLLFGPATIILWINVCVKIRLYKYDYLEAHPEADKKKIPWDTLILKDVEKIGKRTIRGMIFPWKQ